MHALSSRPLVDVVSSDRHTVKPWFAGRTDVSPPVADFAAGEGWQAARRPQREPRPPARRGARVPARRTPYWLSSAEWCARALPAQAVRSGYHMVLWKSGDIESCAVSDAGWDELNTLVGLIKGVSAGDAPH